MPLSQSAATELVKDRLWPAFRKEKEKLDRIDRWMRWDHDNPHSPRASTKEYKELSARSQAPWGSLIVTSVAQALYADGYRAADQADDATAWDWWQANGMDARQIPLHRAALGYGHCYASVLPGEDAFGNPIPAIRGHSPRRFLAFYREPENDDWPEYGLRVEPVKLKDWRGWTLRLYDDDRLWTFELNADSDRLEYVTFDDHGLGFCPVVRYANQLDLEGRTPGEVEPFIPLLARIDQTAFDRLVVQRFSSWVVRTIAGMAKPDDEAEAAAKRLMLKMEDLLVAENVEAKFGSLPATPLDGFIKAFEADIRALAAVSQTPSHELLGQMANLSAEALAAARASLTAKVEERKHTFGESHERLLQLAGYVMGQRGDEIDRSAQIRWRDTEIRSLAQAADALGKLAKMLGVPVEALWEKIPGWTQQDVERARALATEGDSLTDLRRLLEEQAADVEA